MIQDIRFAMRSMAQSRGFAVAVVLTLAIGLGANTIVYSAVDALLLRPLPFGERSPRLVTLHSTHPTQAQDWDNSELSYPDLLDLRESSRTFEAVEGVVNRNLSLSTATETERVLGASVTPGLFRLLGVEPPLGRGFTEGDAAVIGTESVALISDALWRARFGADPAIVGGTIPINGRAVTVIGVMPPRFSFPEHQDVWLPFRAALDEGRDDRSILAVGLLRPGVRLEDAEADARTIAAGLAARHPATNRDWSVHVMPMHDFFVPQIVRRSVSAMLGAVVLVLLVCCANVASLMVARGVSRQRELTVRTALGAGRARLVRLLLIESLLLAVAGGLLGLLIAGWGIDALIASNPEPPPYWARIAIDGRVLAFTAALTVTTSVLCGLLPALRLSRVSLSGALLQGERVGGPSGSQRRLQGTLVAAQIALSFALLAGATLLTRSVMALQHADTGFDGSRILSMRVYLAGDAYQSPEARAAALQRVVERIGALPGVSAAAATGAIPNDDGGSGVRLVPEHRTGTPGEEIGAQMIPTMPGLFDTLGIAMLDGRTFTEAEAVRPDADVVVVNARLAARFWPGQSAVGRQVRIAAADRDIALRVVGVAPDVVYEEIGEETPQSQLNVYVPYARVGWRTMALLARASGDPAALANPVRSVIRDVDPAFAAYDVMTMTARRRVTMWGERFLGRTFAVFACAALLLACIGAYGLTAYSAAQRIREIGIRMAIGATRRDVIRLLLQRGIRLALVGAAAGLPLAILTARGVEGMLYRVSPWWPVLWVMLPLALLGVVVAASFVPANRASRTDPATALRYE